jgi:histidyl-tRNA synthetase
MFPAQLAGQPQVLVTIFDESTVQASLELAAQMRKAGLRVDLHPDHGRYGRQFQYAESRGIRYALILGPREIEAQMVAIKDLESGEQVAVPLAETAAWLLAEIG